MKRLSAVVARMLAISACTWSAFKRPGAKNGIVAMAALGVTISVTCVKHDWGCHIAIFAVYCVVESACICTCSQRFNSAFPTLGDPCTCFCRCCSCCDQLLRIHSMARACVTTGAVLANGAWFFFAVFLHRFSFSSTFWYKWTVDKLSLQGFKH